MCVSVSVFENQLVKCTVLQWSTREMGRSASERVSESYNIHIHIDRHSVWTDGWMYIYIR